MRRIFRNLLLVSSMLSAITAVTPTAAIAVEELSKSTTLSPDTQPVDDSSTASLAQITSVSQLSDVQPTDWAFQALQSLVERYGCIAGYPDSTYRGNRALTRYEFAAGLNACVDRINELIQTSSSNLVNREDLARLQRLQEEFASETALIRGRVDTLEASNAELAANQFSTTTKLLGEVIFAPSYAFGDDLDDNVVLQGRARLNFDTSFTGKDRLRTRLQAGNFRRVSYIGNITNEGRLSFDTDTDNDVGISDIAYTFEASEQLRVLLFIAGGEHDDYLTLIDPLLFSSGTGAISQFALFNPIYNLGGQNAGVAAEYQFTNTVKLSLGYLAGETNDPSAGNGLFNGDYSFLSRLEYSTETLRLSFAYIHTYDDTGFETDTGSLRSQVDVGRPVIGNSYGLQASFSPTSRFTVSGWAGFTDAIALGRGRADVWNYALIFDFPDLGKEGNLLSFVIGQEPKLTGTTGFTVLGRRSDPDTSLHIEALYRYQLTDNISITPGVIWLTAPGHDNNNSDIVVGTVRTTLQF